MHKKDLGSYGELLVAAELKLYGMNVFNEMGDNSRIDLIAQDEKGELIKIQVKCCNRESKYPDATMLYFTKSGPNYRFKYTSNDVDWFAVVDNVTKKIAWVSSDIIDKQASIILRHKAPKNGQTKNVKFFDDFKSPFNKSE